MTMSGPPPPLPPMASPPPVPEGWKAEWCGEYNTWYYFNQATQTSTWENPLNKAPLPPSPPPYARSGSHPPQPQGSLYGDEEKSTTERGFPPVLGRIFGHHHSHSPPVNQNTRPTSPAFQGSAPLYIHAACWCDQDITQKVRGMVTPQQTLSLRCDALTYHFGDPMPNKIKQFSILYSYGQQPWQLLATVEDNEAITLLPIQPVDNYRAQFVQQPTSKIVALVWGIKNALVDAENSTGRSAGLKLMELEREGRLDASNAWMGFDGLPNIVKMAVVYYRNPDGSVSVAAAKEGETLRLPWNALAGVI